MLVTFLFDLFYKLTRFFISSIPEVEVPYSLIDLLAPIANFVGYIDTFVSLPIIVMCMAFILVIDNWNLVVRISSRIWEMIPFN